MHELLYIGMSLKLKNSIVYPVIGEKLSSGSIQLMVIKLEMSMVMVGYTTWSGGPVNSESSGATVLGSDYVLVPKSLVA